MKEATTKPLQSGPDKGELMKRCIARKVLIARLAGMALVALCFLQTQVHAQAGYIVIFPSVGLAPGESVRLTLFNPAGTPVRAQAQIHDTGGITVSMADGSVRAGGFRSFDFKRGDIPLPGEAGTGRLQLRASFRITTAQRLRKNAKVAVSMETIAVSDGTSNTVFLGEVVPSSPGIRGGEDILMGGSGRDVLMGIVPGQTLRVTLFNPPSFESRPGSEVEAEARRKPVTGHIKIFDGSSNVLAQSDEMVIPPGEFRSFDFDRDALGVPGEPGTSRQQLRIKPLADFRSKRLSRVLASFEIVDNSTGKTEVLDGHQCLVFFLGGIPG